MPASMAAVAQRLKVRLRLGAQVLVSQMMELCGEFAAGTATADEIPATHLRPMPRVEIFGVAFVAELQQTPADNRGVGWPHRVG